MAGRGGYVPRFRIVRRSSSERAAVAEHRRQRHGRAVQLTSIANCGRDAGVDGADGDARSEVGDGAASQPIQL